jgi:hypothetical protein
MKERPWSEITRLPEEDLALVSSVQHRKVMSGIHFIVFLVMSATVLAVYLAMNHAFFPGYPVVTAQAEHNAVFEEHYPPFRMSEWANYSITEDAVKGRLFDRESLARKHPIGFPLVAVPLTLAWGEAGPFYTNAFILWISSLVFFFLLIELVSFPTAVGATLGFAFATPNLFYAASAFAEPLGQLLTLVSLYLFLRGATAVNEWTFYLFSGLAAGLNLFVQPVLGCLLLIFIAAFVLDNGRWSWGESGMLFLVGGFAAPLILYVVLGTILTGSYAPFLFSAPYSPYNPSSHLLSRTEANVFLGLWKVFLDTPHGVAALMPALILLPAGFISMWRNSHYSLSLISGALIITVVLSAAGSVVPVTGEGVGARQLVPVIPMLILPLVFLWEEGFGEKAWLGALTALTVFMCTFGWWAGNGGALEDRSARFILLARKNRLEYPGFTDSRELSARFSAALRKSDIKGWLQTLSPESRAEITGIEREVFESLSRLSRNTNSDMGTYIESADPARGVRLLIPELDVNANQERNPYY